MTSQDRRIIIVGAGMAGLTAAAYLSRAGYNVLLIEKNKKCGGLLGSFQREGFTFDVGARSIENSGIIRPMLKELNIDLEILDSPVSLGIEQYIIPINSIESLMDYKGLLEKLYPENIEDIRKIIGVIQKIVKDMAILYGFDNPYFRDLKNDKKYIFKELLPWVGKFIFTLRRMSKKHINIPVEDFLAEFSSNRSLIDIIDQHFFKKTPTFFALGYFYVYLDYLYPKGGTGELPQKIQEKIEEWGGKIQTETEIADIIPYEQKVIDSFGNSYDYDHLIWSADLKTLYRNLNLKNLDEGVSRKISAYNSQIQTKRGGDSIFSLMIGVDESPEKFGAISNGHFFYTPAKEGLGETHWSKLKFILDNFEKTSKKEILQWLEEYCRLNTYEISIPALRDPSLAPEGKTGLILSFLFEYELIKKVKDAGWYEEFKKEIENKIITTMDQSIYPGIRDKIMVQISSNPLDIAEKVGSSEGGITGWSFESSVPVVNKLPKIAEAVKTPIPKVLQAGQWAYSPAGIPTAILTGWHAAQFIIKTIK